MSGKWQVLWILSLLIMVAHAMNFRQKKRICAIGAGPGGLVSADHFSKRPKYFEPIVFEKNSDIGGQWLYTDRTDVDEHGLPVHSSIYKYMRINGPKIFMTFPDYPEFHGEDRSYVRHETVFDYLTNYTKHFNLRRFIRFNTLVEKVSFKGNNQWSMEVRNLNTNKTYATTCDGVIVASGNFHVPNIPEIPGIESFPGRVLHSHTYRRPEEFAGQTVTVLGASFSGLDIGIEISHFAKKVYLSHRNGILPVKLPENMIQVPGVVEADGSELILSDGSRITSDTFLFCTGYLYDYPFLDDSSGITVVDGKYVRPLYKDFINVEHPTMIFLGLPHPGIPFMIPYVQAQYFRALLEGKIKLPSRAEMLKDAQLPLGRSVSQAHHMGVKEFLPYYDELAVTAGIEPLAPVLKYAARIYVDDLESDPWHFKERDLVIYDDGRVNLVDRRDQRS